MISFMVFLTGKKNNLVDKSDDKSVVHKTQTVGTGQPGKKANNYYGQPMAHSLHCWHTRVGGWWGTTLAKR